MGRKRDFQLRWEEEKQTIAVNGETIRFVSIHPFGDETELIDKLGMKSENCTYVGSYIEIGSNIFFVEFNTEKTMSEFFKEGIYFRLNGKRIYSKLIVDEEYLKINHLKKWIQFMLSRDTDKMKQKAVIQLFNIQEEYGVV